MVDRTNHDLDDAFEDHPPGESVNRPARGKRRKSAKGQRDAIRRRAFKVLALLADLSQSQRSAVLKAAERLSKA